VARDLGRLSTRMWAFSTLMAIITLTMAVSIFLLLNYMHFYESDDILSQRYLEEYKNLIVNGQVNSARAHDIVRFFTVSTLRMSTWILMCLTALGSISIGSVFAFLFAKRTTQPIDAVSEASQRFASGDRSARAVADAPFGEGRDLVNNFNRMAAQIEAYERERTILTAGVAHELRTPLTIMSGKLNARIDGLQRRSVDDDPELLRQVEQLATIVGDLKLLANADAGDVELHVQIVDLGSLVRDVADDLMQIAGEHSVSIEVDVDPPSPSASADPGRVVQIVANLLTNAIKHSPMGGRVRAHVVQQGTTVVARIIDEGPGFRNEDAAKMFFPFWRSREATAKGLPGSGMGLALATRYAELLGGSIVACNRSDRSGAVFSFQLPRPTTSSINN
jgi:two-component system sensor histidine kinase AdeS